MRCLFVSRSTAEPPARIGPGGGFRLALRPACDRQPASGQRRRIGTECRPAFTLLEVILVLTILVVIAGLSWPQLLRYLRERTIREEAHSVRVELNRARIKAIDQGLTYQFRFEPDGQRFVVLPYDRPDIGAGSSLDPATGTASTSQPTAIVPIVSGQLPKSCRFDVPKVANPTSGAEQRVWTEKLPDEWLLLIPDGNALRETSWGPPIRFFADGSADDGAVTILDDDRRRIEISVRGFTGTVQASPLVRERQL